MTTSGGGMLLTDDAVTADRVRYLSTQARQPAVHYEHTEIGYNYRLSNVLAALGLAQLERLDEMIGRRRALRERVRGDVRRRRRGPGLPAGRGRRRQLLADRRARRPAEAGWTAEDLRQALDEADIESRPLWKPMHLPAGVRRRAIAPRRRRRASCSRPA